MPALGETPITSYFYRTPSLSKRRNRPEDEAEPSGQGASKRLKQSPASASKNSNNSSLPRAKGGRLEEFFLEGSKNAGLDPNTPMTKTRSKGKTTALPTPPTTGGLATSRRTVPDAACSIQPLTPFLKATTISPSNHLPTPSTLVKPAIPRRKLDDIQTQTGPSASLLSAKHLDISVPSSQSQRSDGMELSMLPPRPILTSKSTLLDFEDDDFVPSSQSQPSLHIITSPRRMRSRQVQPEATFEIPTSQSEELELEIPPEFMMREQGRNPPKRSPTKLPQRTLSDDLFPIPIQESPFAGIFPDDDTLFADAGDPPDEASNLHPSQGSVTESETEDEGQEDSRKPLKASSFRKPTFSQQSATQSSQSSAASFADASFSSLPDAVREFRSMFGEGDESYPADFPESLR